MASQKKQIQIFMTSKDEKLLSEILRRSESDLWVLDGNVWDGNLPPLIKSISECKEGIVFLWNRRIVPDLPSIKLHDGRREGPMSGVVLQFVRSRQSEDLLLSGRIAIGYDPDNKEFDSFVKFVFKTTKTFASNKLVVVNPQSRQVISDKVSSYIVGPDAVKQIKEGTIRCLRDRSTQNYFLPEELKKMESNLNVRNEPE